MRFTKRDLSLEKGLEKEWIITNGIGGYSSSTVIGANTRKYHGLLVAPLTPPARRYVILSKVDESIQIGQNHYDLFTNVGKNYISQGYQYLESFEKEYYPKFTYQVEDTKIEKTICMVYPRNTVCVGYHIKNGKDKAKLTLAPIVNFRDFHQVNYQHEFKVEQKIQQKKVTIVLDENSSTPFYMYASEGEYIKHENDIFRNMFYIEEEKRGFLAEENHAVVGRYEIEVGPEEEKEITFTFSLEDNIESLKAKEVNLAEEKRLNKIIQQTGILEPNPNKKESKNTKEKQKEDELLKEFIIATDNFVVYRPSFRLHTLIAGYHWFLDWGRDAFIAFEGLLLETKRFDIAKEVLLTFTRDIKQGLVPNGYSGYDNRPLYNSVDASLLLFEQVKKYLQYTQDDTFVKEVIYEKLLDIIDQYKKGIDLDDNNIYLDRDGLIVSGTETTQNTWMDAKYGDIAATPRNGKAVEINSMWYNALKIMEELAGKYETKVKARKYKNMAEKCKASFQDKFYCEKKKCLYDVLGDSKIRPNQLFSISLTYPVLEPDSKEADSMMETVNKKLLNKYGLRTLAKGEEGYVAVYEGDGFKRDMTYHQGTTWPWLLGVYLSALENRIKFARTKTKKEKLEIERKEFIEKISSNFEKAFYQEGAVGSINEIYDSKIPYLPKGSIAQAWSISEVFKILLQRKRGRK